MKSGTRIDNAEGCSACFRMAYLIIAAAFFVTSCGEVSSPKEQIFDADKAAQTWNVDGSVWNENELRLLEKGRNLYRMRCAGCHQQSGVGSTTIGAPALKGGAVAGGSEEILIRTVLFGRGSMPAFRYSLDDDALASILSYVRNAWGNGAGDLVRLSSVTVLRAAGK